MFTAATLSATTILAMRALLCSGVLLAGLATGTLASATGASAPVVDNVAVELVSEHVSLTPGQSSQLGIRLRHAAHWHTYWINPGDSGLPTSLSWTLPPGFRAQAIAWPVPKRFDVGGLYNFGYDGDALLPVMLEVPADAHAGTTAPIAVEAKWLVCREACIPGKATLKLDLPIAATPPQPDPRWTAMFARARIEEPEATAWNTNVRVDDARVAITLRGPGLPDAAGVDAFIEQKKIADNKPPAIHRDGDALIVDFGKSEYFGTLPATFDLVVTEPSAAGVRGWRVEVPTAAATTDASKPISNGASP